jgi:pimeloyl-ACP methyl ester carboxylesterase
MKISSRAVRANGIRQHYLTAGDGPPVVLLHGFPETSYAWRYQIPELAKKYHVIAPGLRGYGETDKRSSGYDKRTMAMDLRELMRGLNLPKIALVGHDRGARVAKRFAKDHPEVLDRLVVMDNVPTRIVGRELDATKSERILVFSFSTSFRTFQRHLSLPVRTSGCVLLLRLVL